MNYIQERLEYYKTQDRERWEAQHKLYSIDFLDELYYHKHVKCFGWSATP